MAVSYPSVTGRKGDFLNQSNARFQNFKGNLHG